MLLAFPKRPVRHALALDKSVRATIDAKPSTVTPDARPRSDLATGNHQSEGILFLCAHLRAAKGEAPMSKAIASGEGHNPITSRKVVNLGMPGKIRQIVLGRKPKLSHDGKNRSDDNTAMPKEPGATKFKDDFLARTAAAREAVPFTQDEIAEVLGMSQPKYAKYEKRTPLPHYLIPRFCLACRIDHAWLFTGKGKGPMMPVARLTGGEIKPKRKRAKRIERRPAA